MDLSSGTDRTSTQGGYYDLVRGLFQALEHCQKITIAQVDGPSYGGGVGLAFACDVRIVSQNAKWALTEVKLGVQPAIISRFMAREWGFPFFREAVLSGRDVRAAELLRIGAVHLVAPDAAALDIAVDDYLTGLAKSAPGAAAKCKQLVRLSWLYADGPQHESAIEECFSTMMEPGSEGEYGISQLQRKEPTDWAAFLTSRLEQRQAMCASGIHTDRDTFGLNRNAFAIVSNIVTLYQVKRRTIVDEYVFLNPFVEQNFQDVCLFVCLINTLRSLKKCNSFTRRLLA
jgi:hydroxymethylglutaryl-CoA lyase